MEDEIRRTWPAPQLFKTVFSRCDESSSVLVKSECDRFHLYGSYRELTTKRPVPPARLSDVCHWRAQQPRFTVCCLNILHNTTVRWHFFYRSCPCHQHEDQRFHYLEERGAEGRLSIYDLGVVFKYHAQQATDVIYGTPVCTGLNWSENRIGLALASFRLTFVSVTADMPKFCLHDLIACSGW